MRINGNWRSYRECIVAQDHRRGELDFPRFNLATYGGRAFAYAGPTSWNSLPDSLKDINLTLQTFQHHLKTFFIFHILVHFIAFEVSYKNALYNSTVIIIIIIIIIIIKI